jgi:hypothetical protein
MESYLADFDAVSRFQGRLGCHNSAVCHRAAPVCTGQHERCRGEAREARGQSPGRPVDLQPLRVQLVELSIGPGN